MAKKMKDYQIFKCPYCACEYYDSSARSGKNVGNPMMNCPSCGKELYRSSILEPALIGGKRYFDIKFSSLYGNLRIGLILFYAVFLFFILITRDFYIAMSVLAVAMLLFALYEATRVIHRNMYLRSDEYEQEITHSLERLEDENYAYRIITSQGVEEDSVYYYELYREDEVL